MVCISLVVKELLYISVETYKNSPKPNRLRWKVAQDAHLHKMIRSRPSMGYAK